MKKLFNLIGRCLVLLSIIGLSTGVFVTTYCLINPPKKIIKKPPAKERVITSNIITITLPLLMAVESKSQLAAVLAHEIAHITLGHTKATTHRIEYEYNADLLSIYYLKKAGYNICDVVPFWNMMGDNHLVINPRTHPNPQTRAYYMKMPECKNHVIKKEHVSFTDSIEVFNNLMKNVAGNNRHITSLAINPFTNSINAYVYSNFKDGK